MESPAVIAMVGIATAGALSQYLAWRIKVPAILFLLLAGILAGQRAGATQASTLLLDGTVLTAPLDEQLVRQALAADGTAP